MALNRLPGPSIELRSIGLYWKGVSKPNLIRKAHPTPRLYEIKREATLEDIRNIVNDCFLRL